MDKMKLAIVGSLSKHFSPDEELLVRGTIRLFLEQLRPQAIVSGGADGVDTWAEEEARRLGIEPIIFRPAGVGWKYYKPRNLLIAKEGTHFLRFWSEHSRTYGSGWTVDRARLMGKPVLSYRIGPSNPGMVADANGN